MRRFRMRLIGGVLGVLTLLASVVAVAPGSAGATSNYEDPFFLNWPTFVPSFIDADYEASTEHDCQQGSTKCVDHVIRDMTRRYNQLGCDHDSTFAFTYLLTTEEYRAAVEDPDFFTDNEFINHQDAVFADFYFDQFDAWHRGQVDRVSPAWRIAFHAAENEQVAGMGNVFLGMNAHVNRDLPFVLAAIGLTKPDGTSRKPDHDRVNDFLAAVNQYLLVEAARYLDPTLDDGDVPGTSVDNSTAVQALVAWREQAWRNAERLVATTTQAEWDVVAADIEETAAQEALLLRETYAYNGITNGTAAPRNAFCASHFEDR